MSDREAAFKQYMADQHSYNPDSCLWDDNPNHSAVVTKETAFFEDLSRYDEDPNVALVFTEIVNRLSDDERPYLSTGLKPSDSFEPPTLVAAPFEVSPMSELREYENGTAVNGLAETRHSKAIVAEAGTDEGDMVEKKWATKTVEPGDDGYAEMLRGFATGDGTPPRGGAPKPDAL